MGKGEKGWNREGERGGGWQRLYSRIGSADVGIRLLPKGIGFETATMEMECTTYTELKVLCTAFGNHAGFTYRDAPIPFFPLPIGLLIPRTPLSTSQ